MKKTPKRILVDMSAIRRKGIKFYQKNYFWPVPEDLLSVLSQSDKAIDNSFVNKILI